MLIKLLLNRDNLRINMLHLNGNNPIESYGDEMLRSVILKESSFFVLSILIVIFFWTQPTQILSEGQSFYLMLLKWVSVFNIGIRVNACRYYCQSDVKVFT